MQESYLKVFQKIDTLENEDGFSAWMNIIVNNTAKDFFKKKETVHNDVKFSELDSDDFNESFESTLENDYSDFEPQALVDYTILKEGMEECLNKLSFHEKSTLYKFYYKLQNFMNMAVLGISNALIPILSYNNGAKQKNRVKEAIHFH